MFRLEPEDGFQFDYVPSWAEVPPDVNEPPYDERPPDPVDD
jgi:hypothetical protein